MRGDALASGARSATFSVAPNVTFNPDELKRDLKSMDAEEFCDKYMVTDAARRLMLEDDGRVNNFAGELDAKRKEMERLSALDAQREASLNRECFLEPIVGFTGRVIVARDKPMVREEQSKLLLPKSLRKQKEMLPTTGHVIKARVWDAMGTECSDYFMGKRVVFSPMSGTALCFNGYPTWIQLEVSELLNFVNKSDAELIEETLEPMV